MSLVGRIVGPRPEASIRGIDTLMEAFSFGGGEAHSGNRVTVPGALYLDSVWAAVILLSETVGTLPLKTYQRTRGGGRVEAWFENVYRLLHDEPNEEMPAVVVWALQALHLNTWGNAFLGKERVRGEIVGLWPLEPERMRVERRDGRKVFIYLDHHGAEHRYTTDQVIHIMGPSIDGLTGLSPIAYARHTIGAGLASDEFAARFFRNAAVPRGVLQTDGELSEPAAKRLKAQWDAATGGKNMHKVAVLEGGTKFHPITMPLEDAQFVEQAKLSVQKVARIFNVPAELIGGESGGSLTYSTVEGQALHFLTHGVRRWLVRIEQTLARDRDLFPGRGRTLYPEFVADAMLRADVKTRAEVYTRALDPATGWMRREEVRGLENLPPEAPELTAPMETLDRTAARLLAEADARAAATTNGGSLHAHA
ncbi:phage portal protein [Miltoncostaea oceani]|uniref:phage portal protein n=1 Tax=Miltoncostaea oceani TaxID=2843216 RepID=UPI001C3E7CBD|nr:phage portal protein [Miltoncostaea oceani]